MPTTPAPEGTHAFRGNVRVRNAERLLGFVRVELAAHVEDRGSTWGGRVSGSDYVVWGANGQQVTLEFEDGESASAVFRSGGAIRGLGAAPENLTQ